MRTVFEVAYFAVFALWWPLHIWSRLRGTFALACIAAPRIGFWMGVLAR